MKYQEYKEMAEAEAGYWWHVGRLSIVKDQMQAVVKKGGKILNIGCGTGGTVSLLEEFGQVDNVDVSDEAVEYCKKKGIKKVKKYDGKRLPYRTGSFDTAIALDVLEHIEDDMAALSEWYRVLGPHGKLIITVPAYNWLWSDHDVRLHHFRRYTVSELYRKLSESGFTVKKRSYAIVFTFPLIVAYRIMRSVFNMPQKSAYIYLPNAINKLFIYILIIEGKILKVINMPFGTSAIIVATKGAS